MQATTHKHSFRRPACGEVCVDVDIDQTECAYDAVFIGVVAVVFINQNFLNL